AHVMTDKAAAAWLNFLEDLPANRLVAFTSQEQVAGDLFGKETAAFASRCGKYHLADKDMAYAFAVRARMIARNEGLDGQPLEKYLALVQRCKLNMREVISRIDAGEMGA